MTRRVVELVGLAGAGKTTLANALSCRDAGTTVGVTARRSRMAAGVAALAPVLVAARASTGGRWWTTAELRSLAYLRTWPGALASRPGDGLLLLDHGPVFRLAALTAYGPPMVAAPAFLRWRQHTGETWARTLGAVVWLEAPDEVLLQRIHDRDRDHRVRGAEREESLAFLARYRQAYEAILDVLVGQAVPVVRVDTSTRTPDEIACVVRAALDEAAIGRSP